MTRFFGLAFFVCTLVATTADASARHRARHAKPASMPATLPAPQTRMYYPQDIEGGSTGNLPFNNQIRKHTDPLNANGGR